MNNVRLTAQIVAILLQIYFFIQTILFLACGFAIFPFKPIEDAWLSMIFTLLIVAACELASLTEGILLAISTRSIYSYAYVALSAIVAVLFMKLAYYSTAGTVVCLSLYSILFVWRAIVITRDLIAISQKEDTACIEK